MVSEMQKEARKQVYQAVKNGILVRADFCCLCKRKEGDYKTPPVSYWSGVRSRGYVIVAHHWRGYNHPLDIIWACKSCNTLLGNKTDLSIAQMKELVLAK